MNGEILFNALSKIDDGLIDRCLPRIRKTAETADRSPRPHPRAGLRRWYLYAVPAACLLLVAGVLWAVLFRPKTPLPIAPPTDHMEFPIVRAEHGDSPVGVFRGEEESINPSDITSLYGLSIWMIQKGLVLSCRATQVLPDAYACYGEWKSAPFRLVCMDTVEDFNDSGMPAHFYLLVPERYLIDLTRYDLLIVMDLHQLSYESQVLYNVSRQQPQVFADMIFGAGLIGSALFGDMIFGAGAIGSASLSDSFAPSKFMAFSADGSCDPSLWTASEAWSDATQGMRERASQGGEWWRQIYADNTRAEVEAVLREKYDRDIKVNSLASADTEEEREALAYIAPFENGIFATSLSYKSYLSPDVQAHYIRYINGYPTNERIFINGGYDFNGNRSNSIIRKTALRFSEEDLLRLPDLPDGMDAVDNAYNAGAIAPPHIRDTASLTFVSHGIFGWYAKTERGVLGVVRVTWLYRTNDREMSETRYLADDMYFIIEPESDVVRSIGRDDLLTRLGEMDAYVYRDEYDEWGKVAVRYRDRFLKAAFSEGEVITVVIR